MAKSNRMGWPLSTGIRNQFSEELARHRPRGACGHGGGLHQPSANTNRQRVVETGVSEQRDLCRRSLKDTARRANLSATTLKLAPGAGLAPPRDVSRDAWGGGRTSNHRDCKARDRSATALHKCMFSDTPASTSINATSRPRLQRIGPPPWPQRLRLAKRALLFQLRDRRHMLGSLR